MKPVRVGVIGCGNICDIYFETMKRFPILDVAACADLIRHCSVHVAHVRIQQL